MAGRWAWWGKVRIRHCGVQSQGARGRCFDDQWGEKIAEGGRVMAGLLRRRQSCGRKKSEPCFVGRNAVLRPKLMLDCVDHYVKKKNPKFGRDVGLGARCLPSCAPCEDKATIIGLGSACQAAGTY
jgi:hypothetical protein